MAVPKVKSTYSLDLETISDLEMLAARWEISKSEVLRRVIHAAANGMRDGTPDPSDILDRLQQEVNLTKKQASAWENRVNRERASR